MQKTAFKLGFFGNKILRGTVQPRTPAHLQRCKTDMKTLAACWCWLVAMLVIVAAVVGGSGVVVWCLFIERGCIYIYIYRCSKYLLS